MSLKKMLSEVYTVNFNLLLIKEKQLRELEEHTHFNATNNALKVKKILLASITRSQMIMIIFFSCNIVRIICSKIDRNSCNVLG